MLCITVQIAISIVHSVKCTFERLKLIYNIYGFTAIFYSFTVSVESRGSIHSAMIGNRNCVYHWYLYLNGSNSVLISIIYKCTNYLSESVRNYGNNYETGKISNKGIQPATHRNEIRARFSNFRAILYSPQSSVGRHKSFLR